MRHSARGYNRTDRIADQIQRDLAVLLQREVKDPRVGMVTINSVNVSKDLAFADVYVTFMGINEDQNVEESLEVLEHAGGFLRSLLAKSIKLRVMPRLRFHYDHTIVDGPRMSRLIDRAVAEDKARHRDENQSETDGE
ncbi:30S ribosome-binding factor RbfA [Ketobacter sp.]|uniref:30S ribosome-binding factor RbfA n=1 Tax=Ketobacter sp. TaxID=2083498 RepID=UPI000F11B6F9|nr:30S ribosome-binding factor RbfA [Ketobacter sp.]RLT99371.1 MAG: 30S ribosome-binding factor RbfA [Ketobacter sp.]